MTVAHSFTLPPQVAFRCPSCAGTYTRYNRHALTVRGDVVAKVRSDAEGWFSCCNGRWRWGD